MVGCLVLNSHAIFCVHSLQQRPVTAAFPVISKCGGRKPPLHVLFVMVDFPAEIFDQGFLHPGGNARRVDGDVMFEAVFTNVAEELL